MPKKRPSKTPNTKHQAPEKPQTASAKLATGCESLGDILLQSGLRVVEYPEAFARAWVLKDEPGRPEDGRHPFDLEERTARFGEAVVRLSKKIPRDPSNNRIIDQLVGCGTSVGANYREANGSFSKKDFHFSISRCVKESKETKFFLRMVAASEANLVEEARKLYREAHELHLIFATMYRGGKP
jgi:four helix bundle protein